MHPVTEEGARGVTAYLPGKDEVRGGSYSSFSTYCVSNMTAHSGVLCLDETFSYLVCVCVFLSFGLTSTRSRSTMEPRTFTFLSP